MTKMKKTIAILLAVLFLLTVTAGAVSAGGGWGWCGYGYPNIKTTAGAVSEIGHNVAGVTYNAESVKNIPIAATSANILTTSVLVTSIDQFQAHGGWGK